MCKSYLLNAAHLLTREAILITALAIAELELLDDSVTNKFVLT